MKCVQLPRHRRLDCMMLYRTNVYISFPKFPPTEPVAENRHCCSTHTALTREKNEAIPYNCCCVDALSCCGFHALGERNSFVRNFIDRGAKAECAGGKCTHGQWPLKVAVHTGMTTIPQRRRQNRQRPGAWLLEFRTAGACSYSSSLVQPNGRKENTQQLPHHFCGMWNGNTHRPTCSC